MNWENIIIIGIAVALVLIWIPILLYSVRKTIRKETPRQNGPSFRYSRPVPESYSLKSKQKDNYGERE